MLSSPDVLEPGSVIASRFEVAARIGGGGMGEVFRGRDLRTEEPVAIKAALGLAPHELQRFGCEIEVLLGLSHPRIVRYIDQGVTPEGAPFLVMEWLEGEDLAARLARGPLSVAESVTLVTALADALGYAHAQRVIHRDLKPANVFLRAGRVEDPVLIDFGVARRGLGQGQTRSGAVVGTPMYMAPEQARGSRTVDARADVFALGCVLFECVAGEPAFVGETLLAVFARLLVAQGPSLAERVSECPPALDALLARMLAADPDLRPADGAEACAALNALARDDEMPTRVRASLTSLTDAEQRIVSVVIALPDDALAAMGRPDATTPAEHDDALTTRARRIAAAFGARIEPLFGGVVVVLDGRGPAGDLAARAARCALTLRDELGGATLALAIGRARLDRGSVVGDVVDRAAALLTGRACEVTEGPRPVRLDPTAASLLDARFEVLVGAQGAALRGRSDDAEGERLMGRTTPFVGREREIAWLHALLDDAVSETCAKAALVTGPPGSGKSRLRREWQRAVRDRSSEVVVLLGRGDPMSAGAPFSLLAAMARAAFGVVDGDPLDARAEHLREGVDALLSGDAALRARYFLGELVGATFSGEPDVRLRAARSSPLLMGDQIRTSIEDWLRALCARGPVLLLLEDLHWGDPVSVRCLDAALRALRDRPLVVVGLARPEVHRLFPMLWAGRGLHEIVLAPLSRRASERLVLAALGEDVDATKVGALVAQADGNPLFLEELVRAHAEGGQGSASQTVLAVAQARLDAVPTPVRRVLRAASVFGRVFWREGVSALLGAEVPDEVLNALAEREWVDPRRLGRFDGEFAYRHGLLRDAAYASLTEEDRALGHRLAGAWLESVGERQGAVLAEHYARGGQPDRARGWLRRAAEQALEGNDLTGALDAAERAIEAGAEGVERGALRLLQAEVHMWRGTAADSERCGAEAMGLLAQGSAGWFRAGAEVAVAQARQGKSAEFKASIGVLMASAQVDPEARREQIIAVARLCNRLLLNGERDEAERLLPWLEAHGGAIGEVFPVAAAQVYTTFAFRSTMEGQPQACARLLCIAAEQYDLAGDARGACGARANAGFSYLELGDLAQAEALLCDALATATRLGVDRVAAHARQNLGVVLGWRGAVDEALAVERSAAEGAEAAGDVRGACWARIYLARIERERGDFAAALAEIARVLDSTPTTNLRAGALAQRALVHLAQGSSARAYDAAAEAIGTFRKTGRDDEGEADVRLAWIQCLEAVGRDDDAREARAEATAWLDARAARIPDAGVRRQFLFAHPIHAGLMGGRAKEHRCDPKIV